MADYIEIGNYIMGAFGVVLMAAGAGWCFFIKTMQGYDHG